MTIQQTEKLDFTISRLTVCDLTTLWVDRMLQFYSPDLTDTRHLYFVKIIDSESILVSDILGREYIAKEVFERNYCGSVCGIYTFEHNDARFYIAMAKKSIAYS